MHAAIALENEGFYAPSPRVQIAGPGPPPTPKGKLIKYDTEQNKKETHHKQEQCSNELLPPKAPRLEVMLVPLRRAEFPKSPKEGVSLNHIGTLLLV